MRQSLIGRENNFIEFAADFDLSFFREIVNKEKAFFDDIDVMSVIGLVSKLITDFGQKFVLILNVEFFVKFSIVNQVLSDFLAGLMIESKVFGQFLRVGKIILKAFSLFSEGTKHIPDFTVDVSDHHDSKELHNEHNSYFLDI